MSRFSARTGCSASGACVDLLAEIAVGAEVSDERCSPFRPQFFVGGMEQLAFGVRAVLSRSQQIPQQAATAVITTPESRGTRPVIAAVNAVTLAREERLVAPRVVPRASADPGAEPARAGGLGSRRSAEDAGSFD